MHHKLLMSIAILFAISCGKGKTSGSSDSKLIEENSGTEENTTTENPIDKLAGLSLDSKLKFKKQKILEQEIMTSLDLKQSQICTELDSLSCMNDAHHLTLGGVDPYEKNIWENKNSFLETTPIVVERIVWSACQKRVELDLVEGEAKLFSKGSMSDSTHMDTMISRLYQNLLARDPSPKEVSAMKEFAVNLEKKGGVYQDWANLSCFSLMTSVEFLFY